jgi:hypothetical protein
MDAAGNTTVKEFALIDEEQVQLGTAISPIWQRLAVRQNILLAVA